MKKNSFSTIKNKRKTAPSLSNKSYSKDKSTPNEPKNEIPIIDLLKCPICKNICLMNINKDKLFFSFECNNKHNNSLKKSKTYLSANENYLNSNISDINLIQEKTDLKNKNKDNNTSNPTVSNDSIKTRTQKIYINESDFLCSNHNIKYQSYCTDCKQNICDECNEKHLNHNKILLKEIKPNENEVISCKNEVIKKEEELNNIIEKMMKWKKEFDYGLNTIIKIMQNISNLKRFIIKNYDIKQSNQNYNYIKNFNNMKTFDYIFPELQEFYKEKYWKKKGYILIELIINIHNKIIKNKEKLKIMKLKEEIDKKTEILRKKLEFQENNTPKGRNKNNEEDNLDMENFATSHSINNFYTTFNSDCDNNNYKYIHVSGKKVKKINDIKRKIIERRKKIKDDNTLSRTIDQNKELEKKLNYDNDIKKEPEMNLDKKIIKSVESKNGSNMENIEESQNLNKLSTNNDKNSNNTINKSEYNKDCDKILNIIEDIKNSNNKEINDVNSNEKNDKNSEINRNEINENNKNFAEELYELCENKIDNSKYSPKINNEIKSEHNKVLRNNNKQKEKYIYKNIELKYELIDTDIIRSIEFINNNLILICTLENISIYKLNPDNYELIKVYDIKEFNYRINYAVQLSNNDLVICSLNSINIIKLLEKEDSLSYSLIQKINGKKDSYNINKVIEIEQKNLLISCDKNNLIKFSKNNEKNLYEELNYLNTNSEVKCIELINDDLFVAVEPEVQSVIFYKVDEMEKNYIVNNIQSSFGRYAISYIPQNNCILVTGSQGIYLISIESLKLISFFKVGEWISSIAYDYYNEYLICGTWKINTTNKQKMYNLIIYEIGNDNFDKINTSLEDMKIREVERKNTIHANDIVVIKPSEKGFILTGSNDRTVKLWK